MFEFLDHVAKSRKLSPGSLSFQQSELVLPEGLGGMGGGTPPQQVATPGPFLQPIPVLCRDLGVPRAGPFLGSSGWVPKRPSNGETCPR